MNENNENNEIYKYTPSPPPDINTNPYHNINHDIDQKGLFLLLLILFCMLIRIWYEFTISRHNNIINENANNINERLINHEACNPQNIEKIEIQFKNNLYQNECTICLENFNENEKLYELSCKHYYHKDCIDDWLSKKNTCPLCRLNLI